MEITYEIQPSFLGNTTIRTHLADEHSGGTVWVVGGAYGFFDQADFDPERGLYFRKRLLGPDECAALHTHIQQLEFPIAADARGMGIDGTSYSLFIRFGSTIVAEVEWWESLPSYLNHLEPLVREMRGLGRKRTD